jgi:hypothetical protein
MDKNKPMYILKIFITSLLLCFIVIPIHANICPLDKELSAMFHNGEAFERQMVNGMLGVDITNAGLPWIGRLRHAQGEGFFTLEINHRRNGIYVWLRGADTRIRTIILIIMDATHKEIYRREMIRPTTGRYTKCHLSRNPIPKNITDKMLYFKLEDKT